MILYVKCATIAIQMTYKRGGILAKTVTTTIRLDKELKDEMTRILDSMGLSVNAYFAMAAKQLVLKKKVPFEILSDESEEIKKAPTVEDWDKVTANIPVEHIEFDENGHYDPKKHPEFDEWVRKG